VDVPALSLSREAVAQVGGGVQNSNVIRGRDAELTALRQVEPSVSGDVVTPLED
jgi:hypothetical protein